MATKPTKPAAAPAAAPPATPALDALLREEPDLVDRIFDFAVKLLPEIAQQREPITQALRDEFAGERAYIRRRSGRQQDPLMRKVLKLFNGRNASEVARELRIGRATVYRKIKQSGPA